MPPSPVLHRAALIAALALNISWLAACTVPTQSETVAAPASTPLQVFKPRGSLQCEGRGTAPELMRAELERAGVRVLSAQCGSDGRMVPAVCGGATGEINLFEIDAEDAERARALGFAPLSELRGEAQVVPCR